MISKIKFISSYKILGIPIEQAAGGYDARLKIVLEKPFSGSKIRITSQHITDIPGLVMLKPIIDTTIDIPQNKKKRNVVFTEPFFNPIVPRGFSHVAFSVKVTDEDDTVIEEEELSLELVNEDDVKHQIRDDVVLVAVIFTLIISFVTFLYK